MSAQKTLRLNKRYKWSKDKISAKLLLLINFVGIQFLSLPIQGKTTDKNILLLVPSSVKSSLAPLAKENFLLTQTHELDLAQALSIRYLKKQPSPDISTNLTLIQAQEIQEKFLQYLMPEFGKIIGYKAGLTNKLAQEKFNASHPVLGIFLEKMLLKTGATIPANFGAAPLLEGDLMVRVGNDKINTAKTPREALEALDAVIPFLELPDLVYSKEVKLNAPKIVAINVGARLGVMGEPIPLKANDEWQKRLKNIKLIILDKDRNPIAVGESNFLLGDPLEVVLWLRDALKTQGKSLQQGDLLSLGTITPPMLVKAGDTIYARYLGLDANVPVEISVHFE